MNCAKCGKNMTKENSLEREGVQFHMESIGDQFERDQLGKYADKMVNGELNMAFCFECFIDALMGGKEVQ